MSKRADILLYCILILLQLFKHLPVKTVHQLLVCTFPSAPFQQCYKALWTAHADHKDWNNYPVCSAVLNWASASVSLVLMLTSAVMRELWWWGMWAQYWWGIFFLFCSGNWWLEKDHKFLDGTMQWKTETGEGKTCSHSWLQQKQHLLKVLIACTAQQVQHWPELLIVLCVTVGDVTFWILI